MLNAVYVSSHKENANKKKIKILCLDYLSLETTQHLIFFYSRLFLIFNVIDISI